jgi:hypothetical protein
LWFNHGIINFSQMLDSTERGPPIVFNLFKILGLKFGLIKRAEPQATPVRSAYGPGGVTLPGAAYHDYGWAGFVLVAVLFASAFGASLHAMQRSSLIGLVGIGVFPLCFYVLFLANMLVGYNIMPFPFIAFSLAVSLGVVAYRQRRAHTPPTISPDTITHAI